MLNPRSRRVALTRDVQFLGKMKAQAEAKKQGMKSFVEDIKSMDFDDEDDREPPNFVSDDSSSSDDELPGLGHVEPTKVKAAEFYASETDSESDYADMPRAIPPEEQSDSSDDEPVENTETYDELGQSTMQLTRMTIQSLKFWRTWKCQRSLHQKLPK